MKKFIRLSLALIALTTANVSVSKAAFPIKQETVAVTPAEAPQETVAVPVTAATDMVTLENHTIAKKQNFFSRMFSTVKSAASSVMPQVLYVILAIIGLGWLAMGINDNFSDFDWLISLVLYFLLYIPGLIYTLIKMGKYY